MPSPNKVYFDHEKLNVYQEAVAFVAWLTPILERTSKAGDVKDQLDRASTSIPLNIAEGNGKYHMKDRCRSFDVAYGSALECASCLDTLVATGKLSEEEIDPGKMRLVKIVNMLVGLIQRSADRKYEKSRAGPVNESE